MAQQGQPAPLGVRVRLERLARLAQPELQVPLGLRARLGLRDPRVQLVMRAISDQRVRLVQPEILESRGILALLDPLVALVLQVLLVPRAQRVPQAP